MRNFNLERMSVDHALMVARRRAEARVPFSPAWDAAMGLVEDLEREAFQLDALMQATSRGLVRQP
jgi:hypothetical protein